LHSQIVACFLRHLGDFVGGWGKIAGFLREERQAASAWILRARLLVSCGIILLTVFLAFIFYLRETGAAGSSHTYLYLEVGGTLLSFCYAANALVRFRGTHDRTALILAFGFALSGIIETVGYFGLNEAMASGPVALSSIPAGWMVSRTLLAVLLLAALAVDRFMPTARQRDRGRVAGSRAGHLFDERGFSCGPRRPDGACCKNPVPSVGFAAGGPVYDCRSLFPPAPQE
jgi:hypothetical protein